jgi:hypothetical protein
VQLGDWRTKMPQFRATRFEGSSAVKYFFFVLALRHAPVSLSAESALPPAQRPPFGPANRFSKDMGKPGIDNCETPVSAASRARTWPAAIALSAGAFD